MTPSPCAARSSSACRRTCSRSTSTSSSKTEGSPAIDDRYRPRYHFLPPSGWIQDPNGAIHHRGRYHLFYQYDPKNVGAFGCDPEWGHAVSTDLLHWRHLPPALTPGTTGPDRNGCWSGCTVIADGVPTILYSGLVRKSLALEDRVWCLSQCLATGSDDLVHWRKHPGNPILADPPEEYRGRLNAWHDPHVWREGDTWYLLLGGAYQDGSAGLTFLYRSADLITWEYLHPFCEGTVPCERWLVPDFFPSGDRHVMLFSDGATYALIGDYRDHRFLARRRQRVDHGPQFDSARTLCDASGRRLLFGWIREDRPVDASLQAGWAGMMSLPRALSVEDGELRIDVPPEVRAATAPDAEVAGVDLAPCSAFRIDGADGDCLEVEVEIDVQDAASVGLALSASPGGEEQTTVFWHRDEQVLRLDRTRSSLDPDVGRGADDAPLPLTPGEPLRLTVFLDRSVVEAFANRRSALTARIYPTHPDSTGVELVRHRQQRSRPPLPRLAPRIYLVIQAGDGESDADWRRTGGTSIATAPITTSTVIRQSPGSSRCHATTGVSVGYGYEFSFTACSAHPGRAHAGARRGVTCRRL